MKSNMRIRLAMLEHSIKAWQLAKMLGISEATYTRRFREELPEEEQERIINMIKEESKK